MKTTAFAVLLAATTLLPSCATSHAVRWVYGEPSTFNESENDAVDAVLKPTFAVPMIVGGAMFDVITLPFQAAFGVWPWWGDASRHVVPDTRESGRL